MCVCVCLCVCRRREYGNKAGGRARTNGRETQIGQRGERGTRELGSEFKTYDRKGEGWRRGMVYKEGGGGE